MKRTTIYPLYCLLMTAMVAAIMSACQYKDFDDDGDSPVDGKVPVTLHFDWQDVDSIPSLMQVMFYRGDTSGYQRFDVGNHDTTVMIRPGDYRVTAWNNDATHVYFNGYGQREDINATTPEYNPQNAPGIRHLLDSIFPGQKVLDYPDYMVHANKTDVVVSENMPRTIILPADSMVVTVDVNIGGVAGLEIVRGVKGVLGNVAGRRYMAYDNRTTDPSAVLFAARSNAADSTITARFWVFGLEPEELQDGEHKAALFFWTAGGNVFFVVDVTEQVRQAGKNPSRLTIDIPDMDVNIRDFLPQTGLDINIDDWNNREQSIGF